LVDRVRQSKDLVALIEGMRIKTKERVTKSRQKQKAKGVLRNTNVIAAETPDVRARIALEVMKDAAAVELIKAQP